MFFISHHVSAVALFVTLFLGVSLAQAAGGSVVVLDTFEDDTLGQPPNGPEIGSYGSTSGTLSVVDVAGDRQLRGTSSLQNVSWVPASTPSGIVRLSYDFFIGAGATWTASNAISQTLHLSTAGAVHTLDLDWGNDLRWRLDGQIVGSAFQLDKVYSVRWIVDLTTNRYALLVGSQVLAFGAVIPVDVLNLVRFSVATTSSTSATWRIDDVRATVSEVFIDGFESGDVSRWSNGTQPTGNECSDARPLPEDISTLGDLSDNSGSTGDDSSCGSGDTIDEWFTLTASCNGTLVVSTCNPGTEFDTVVSVYDGCGAISEAACDDDGTQPSCDLNGSLRKSLVTVPVTVGQKVNVRVAVFNSTFPDPASTEFELFATCNTP